ncbi:hypothetical protein D9756_006670 [Leucocoprinus leucothites]|uniref:F-box domain-containing protein n=1 Tax=Leucocoprinus leucothites TaxID=201217 RepID=A0A8H5LGY0_9AGAR|nr:hypothetical protein D9756_006670 [Leucoagaricus leucothites]
MTTANYIIEPLDPLDPGDPAQPIIANDLESPASETGESEQAGEKSVAIPESRAGMDASDQLMFVSESSAIDISLLTVVANDETNSLKPSPSADVSRDAEPRAKRGRFYEGHREAEERDALGAPPTLLTLPFDLLLEILSRTSYPGDLLAVARTCKSLCRKLTDASTYHLWRKMRRDILLPDPAAYEAEVEDAYNSDGSKKKITGVENFINNEPAYAAFIFDGGPCEICDDFTNRSYRSFALRIRLCGNSDCLEKIKKSELLSWKFMSSQPQSITSVIPVLEVNRIFRPSSLEGERATRASLIEVSRASNPSSEEINLASAKNDVWMQLCVALFKWNQIWQRNLRKIHSANESMGKKFAENEGWNYSVMVNETTYGPFRTTKYKLRENITDEELQHLRPTISRELYLFQRKKEAKIQTRLREANADNIFKLYQKLMSQPVTYPNLPPFAVFLNFPATKILQSSELVEAGYDVRSAVAGKSCIMGMLKKQIEEWAEKAKQEMLNSLDESADWNSMVSGRRMTHPVLRLDAWWKCKICNRVEPKYDIDGCLDFAGVCRHQCQEEDKKKKKKGAVTRTWSAGNFVKDDQASAVMKQCLERLGIDVEEEAEKGSRTKFNETLWRCTSCNPPLFLRAKSVIGHSHRHMSPMQVEILPQFIPSTMKTRPNLFGLARWLSQSSRYPKEEVVKINFGCQHCVNKVKSEEAQAPADPGQDSAFELRNTSPKGSAEADAPQDTLDPGRGRGKRKEFVNKFNFNGLRSHLSSK